MQRVLLIANPQSAQGGAALDAARAIFRDGGLDLDASTSASTEDMQRRIRDARGHADAVFLLGGDGTLHHALPAVLDSGLPLGVLPGGTANDYARSLGMPLDLEGACHALLDGRLRQVDVGYAADTAFINAVHVGLVATAASSTSVEAKRHFGSLAYLKSVLDRLRRERGFAVEIDCDGQRRVFRSIQVTAGNAPYFGGGNLVHADAALDDGLLDAYSVRPTNVMRLVFTGLLLRWGRGDEEVGVDRMSCRRLTIRTRRPMEVTADGETVGYTPVELRLDPGALTVIVPREPIRYGQA